MKKYNTLKRILNKLEANGTITFEPLSSKGNACYAYLNGTRFYFLLNARGRISIALNKTKYKEQFRRLVALKHDLNSQIIRLYHPEELEGNKNVVTVNLLQIRKD